MPTPIVLLPGIMGSRLYFQNSGKFWDPDDKPRMAAWLPLWPFRSDDDNRRALHASEPAGVIYDTSSNVDAAHCDRGWSTVAWDYYGPMLQKLEQQFAGKTTVYAVGYDWRQDIQWLGEYAAKKINAIPKSPGDKPPIIITHSMGGLVIRSAIRSGALNPNSIGALLHICIPAAGAVNLYRRMFTGMLSQYDGDWAFRFLLGNSRKGFLGNMSGLPGAAELLPNAFFPPDDQGQVWNSMLSNTPFNNLYSNAISPPGLVPSTIGLSDEVLSDLNNRVKDVADFQAFFGDPADKLHPETWLIYGLEQKTETRVSFQPPICYPYVDPRKLGDGTVPKVSATSLNLDPSRVRQAGVEHSMACADPYVQLDVNKIVGPYV